MSDAILTARAIAGRFGDDGQCFENAAGESLVAVCEGAATWVHGRGTDAVRYEFADGSALIIAGAGWDFAISDSSDDCRCWAGADNGRHQEGCSDAEEG